MTAERHASGLRRPHVLLLMLALLAATACVPFRLEAGWPVASRVELPGRIYDGNVFLTYNDKITMIDPDSGQPARLRNADGEVCEDEETRRAFEWEFRGPQDDDGRHQYYVSPLLLPDKNRLLVTSIVDRPALFLGRKEEYFLYEISIGCIIDTIDKQVDLKVFKRKKLLGRVLATPLEGDDLIYVSAGRTLLALERDRYEERWRFETGQSIWSKPLLLNGKLLFTSLDHHLYALDPADGSEIWRLNLGGAAPVAPTVYEGRLYTGSFARKIFAISPDGKILADFVTEDWTWGAPTIVDGVLYAADLGGNVYALEIGENNFRLLWRSQASERAIRAAPVVSGDYVIVAARDQKLHWLGRADGRIYFSRELAGEIVSDMLLHDAGAEAEPLLLVSTLANEEALVAFGVQNGDRRWTYSR